MRQRIKNFFQRIREWRIKREVERRAAQHFASMLADLNYHALHGCVKTLVEQIESGAIDDVRRRRLIVASAKDVLASVSTPSRAYSNPVFPNQVQL